MKTKLTKLIYALLFVFVYQYANATHNMAGHISYKHISGFLFEITITTYSNTLNTAADRCELTVYFGDGDSALVPRINGPSSLCTAPLHDGVMISGSIKHNIYKTTHMYPSVGYYFITMEDPNLTPGICNISNSVTKPFSLSAALSINIFTAFNNSVTYTTIPIKSDTVGVISNYNPLANDIDGDSLFYEIDTPAIGYTHPSYSNSFSINSSTGIVTWNSPVNICNYIYLIKVSEYKKIPGTSIYTYVGFTTAEVWNSVTYSTSILENDNNKLALSIFPNPSTNQITLTISNLESNKNIIEIKNVLGQTLKSINYSQLSATNNTLNIDTHEFPAGVYFIQLQSENQVISKSFIKQ